MSSQKNVSLSIGQTLSLIAKDKEAHASGLFFATLEEAITQDAHRS